MGNISIIYEAKTPEALKLLEYWNLIGDSSDGTHLKRTKQKPLEKLLSVLAEESSKAIKEWDLNDYVQFFDSFGLLGTSIKNNVFEIKKALKYAGIDDSICDAAEIINRISLSQEYILSFEQLYKMLNDVISANNDRIDPDKVFDAHTSSKVLLCLSWFGLSQTEIANIKIRDLDINNKRIRYTRGGCRLYIDLSQYNSFRKFLTSYSKINGMYRKNVKSETGYCYVEFKSSGEDAPLLRNSITDLLKVAEVASRAKNYFGISFKYVQKSGRLNALYHYELNGGDMNDSETVLSILNKKPTSNRKYQYDKDYIAFKKQMETFPVK